MEFSKIPVDAFEHIQMGAGMLVDSFDPATKEFGNIIGATTGGIQVSCVPTFSDYADDIDNAPKNTMEFKKVDDYEVTASGTFVTITTALAKMLVATGVIDSQDATHITVRKTLTTEDFKDAWIICDYSDKNTGAEAGCIAVHIMNALNTGGFSMKTTDRAKGNFAFNLMGHYSASAQDVVPLEIYIIGGASEVPSVKLNKHSVTLTEGDTEQLSVVTVPNNATVTWTPTTGSYATVDSTGKVTAVGEGSAIVTAAITVNGITYNDTCTVIVEVATEG